MAHQIDFSNGRANMAFVGDRANIWHGLGQQLTDEASIDVWKVEAGMNWVIESSPIIYDNGVRDGNPFPIYSGKRVLFRSDTKEALSIVSNKYNVVQPEEVLEFFRDLTEDLGMKMSTAGCLFGGRKFWALADTGLAGKVLGDDEVKGYTLLTSSCDGSSPTIAQFTSIRVVCNNTLEWSLQGSSSKRASVRHRRVFSPRDIKASLGLVHSSWDAFMDSITVLSEKKVTDKMARKFIENLLVNKGSEITDAQVRKTDAIFDLFKNGMGADMSRGTLWGVVNGVTEFVDHHSGGRIGDTKLWNSWYGNGATLKNKAFENALALL
jgi:phage/plasmid-like protein (TIGR03299 family)